MDRIQNEYSLFPVEKPENCAGYHAHWRVVKCDGGDIDVVECSRCGAQKTTRCNFDDDMS